MGAVSGAQFGLKIVTSATMKPPKTPPIIQGMAAPGTGECDKPQVHAAVATTQSSRRPVLLTVPCNVIASPKATWPLKAFSLSAGLDVRIRFAIWCLPVRLQISVYAGLNPSSKLAAARMGGALNLLCHRRFGFGLVP